MKLSADPRARPPETMRLAPVSSGRSDFVSSSPTNADLNGPAGAAIVSTLAEPPSSAAGKVVVRTVTTFLGSVERTVVMALPA